MIAVCGMNCLVCYVYRREKKACQGCLGEARFQPAHCQHCKKKACAAGRGVAHCYQCSAFPCALLRRLDKSYRQRYQVSLVENSLRLQQVGQAQFLQEERARWTCPGCGGVVVLHTRQCSACGQTAPSSLL